MSQASPRRFERFRLLLRWTRRLLLLLLLFVTSSIFYLNYVGIPKFLQNQVESGLRARGISFQARHIRVRGYRELLAEDIRFSPTSETNQAQFLADTAELQLDAAALKEFRFQIGAVRFQGGKVLWPIPLSNAPLGELSVDDIKSELRFLRNDQWELTNLAGRFLNADVQITGKFARVRELQRMLTSRATAEPRGDLQQRLSELATNLQNIKLSPSTKLRIHLDGDGQHPERLRATIHFDAPSAVMPWGRWEKLQLTCDLSPPQPERQYSLAALRLRCDALESIWGQATNTDLHVRLTGDLTNKTFTRADWQLNVSNVNRGTSHAKAVAFSGKTLQEPNSPSTFQTAMALNAALLDFSFGRMRTNEFVAEFTHPLTDLTALKGTWRLACGETESERGRSGSIVISGQVAPADKLTDRQFASQEQTLWRYLQPFVLSWTGELNRVESPKAVINKFQCIGEWRAPELNLPQIRAEIYDGQLEAEARLNVDTRELQSQTRFDFDVHRISQVLTPNAQRWLRQFSWERPPRVSAEARLILPAWTNAHPNWHVDVLPSVKLSGEFEGKSGSFRKVPVTSARSHFTLTNFFWRLPDLLVERPEGNALLDYAGDMRTQEYHWSIQSAIDPKAIKPMFEPSQHRALDYFEFTAPPLIQGEIWGRWGEPERTGFLGRVAATNFTFRGETCSQFSTGVRFTNLFFNFNQVEIRRGPQQMTALAAGYDLREQVIFLTNGLSTMDPDVVTKVIGSKVRAAIRPYHFHDPPTVIGHGRLPTTDVTKADVHFRVAGKSFSYWKFNVPEISGDIHWRGDMLSITNVQARFYNGKLAWEGHFDFTDDGNPRFGFRGSVAETDLHSLMGDLTSTNNHLEGVLTGNLIITSANANDWKSWNGFGDARLRDGFLWEIPIFGAFSPMLDKIVPGLGKSRASAGKATFSIDQSVIETSNLEIRSPALRLQYDGRVDFNGNVNARLQAEILRDAWGVGRLVSLALWPLAKVFEYKVTGTLNHPKSEPLYIPKVLMWPFHPLRTLKEILSSEGSPANFPGSSTSKPDQAQ